jgi:hypothetical protein
MRITASVLAISALLVAGPSIAQTNGPIGAGAVSCGEYLSHRAMPPDRDTSAQWASGLIVGKLSAAGHYIPEDLTVHEVAARLGDYCSKNEAHQIVLAAMSLAREYQARP